MFEERRSRNWNWSWAGILVVVVGVLAVIQIFRVNAPEKPVASGDEKKVVWTEGTVVSGVIEVPAGGFLSYPLNFNKKTSFEGFFRTGDNAKRLACSIIEKSNLEKWKLGGEVNFVSNTGAVPRGFVKRVIDPGYYILIIDNRMNAEAMTLVESDFKVN